MECLKNLLHDYISKEKDSIFDVILISDRFQRIQQTS